MIHAEYIHYKYRTRAVVKKLQRELDVINRGGEVSADKGDPKKWTNFNLRIREDLLKQIDGVLEDRVGISKTGWILEAIQEKIKKDSHT